MNNGGEEEEKTNKRERGMRMEEGLCGKAEGDSRVKYV